MTLTVQARMLYRIAADQLAQFVTVRGEGYGWFHGVCFLAYGQRQGQCFKPYG